MRLSANDNLHLEEFSMTKENPPSRPVPDSSQPKGTSRGPGSAPSTQKGGNKG